MIQRELNIKDESARECLANELDTLLSALSLARVTEQLKAKRLGRIDVGTLKSSAVKYLLGYDGQSELG